MTREEWLDDAEDRIIECHQTIARLDGVSSCDRRYWNEAKADAECAVSLKKFLQAGIKLLKEVRCVQQSQ